MISFTFGGIRDLPAPGQTSISSCPSIMLGSRIPHSPVLIFQSSSLFILLDPLPCTKRNLTAGWVSVLYEAIPAPDDTDVDMSELQPVVRFLDGVGGSVPGWHCFEDFSNASIPEESVLLHEGLRKFCVLGSLCDDQTEAGVLDYVVGLHVQCDCTLVRYDDSGTLGQAMDL